MSDKLGSRTVKDFGEQWTRYRDNDGYYGSVDMLADVFGPLLPLEDVRDADVADIGSGSGRIVLMLLNAGARSVTAVEPSAAMDVLRANTASHADRIRYVCATGDGLPDDRPLDLVVSLGVIHHIPEPAPVMQAALKALRPGGRCLVWLYGREGNEAYLRVVEPLRRVTAKLPHPLLSALCSTLNVALSLYIAAARRLPRLPMRDYVLDVAARCSRAQRYLIIYDQLNPAYAKYYTRQEAESLMKEAGFHDVRSYHRHGYSWTVIGTRPQ